MPYYPSVFRWLVTTVLLLTACQSTLEIIARSKQDGAAVDADSTDSEVGTSADADADVDDDIEEEPDSDLDADRDLDDEGDTDGDVVTSTVGMAAGGYHSCLWNDGAAWCWGANNNGQLGDGSRDTSPLPVRVSALSDVVGMTASDRSGGTTIGHSCAWNSDGDGWCWGSNNHGQLGDGTRNGSREPLPLDLSNVAGLSAGADHTCAWTLEGSAWCWGLGDEGQLGNGVGDERLVPTEVPFVANVTLMSAGVATTCAVERSGSVLCWGLRLGMGGNESPTVVSGPDDAVDVSVGEGHACIRERDASLHCWGWNDYGQLGIGTTEPSPFTNEVDLPPIENASAGGTLTCAVSSGDVSCWGFQVGDPMGEIHVYPFAVPDLPDIEGAVAGYQHGCAYSHDGSAYCWGINTYGAVGNGEYRGELSPVPVLF